MIVVSTDAVVEICARLERNEMRDSALALLLYNRFKCSVIVNNAEGWTGELHGNLGPIDRSHAIDVGLSERDAGGDMIFSRGFVDLLEIDGPRQTESEGF